MFGFLSEEQVKNILKEYSKLEDEKETDEMVTKIVENYKKDSGE